jgi:hypothetical protein
MPSVSKKQHNFMAAVAKNPKFAKKAGVPSAVGKDFLSADKGKTFKQGGTMKHSDIKMDKKVVKKAVGMHDKQQHGGKKTDLATLKKGGMACAPKKMASGGLSAGHKAADGIASKGKTKGTMISMKKGGAC